MKPTTDKGPMWRLGQLKADPEAPARIFQMLTSGHDGAEFPKASLTRVAKELGVPKGSFLEWFTTEHPALYESSLRVVAADLAIRAVEAAMAATPEDVQVKRLQSDVFLKLASRFDRARYGEQAPIARSEYAQPDAGLLLAAGALLERLGAGPAVQRLPEKVLNPKAVETK